MMISIHALREERDQQAGTGKRRRNRYFNPRAPRGARRSFPYRIDPAENISIHALREERDERAS